MSLLSYYSTVFVLANVLFLDQNVDCLIYLLVVFVAAATENFRFVQNRGPDGGLVKPDNNNIG